MKSISSNCDFVPEMSTWDSDQRSRSNRSSIVCRLARAIGEPTAKILFPYQNDRTHRDRPNWSSLVGYRAAHEWTALHAIVPGIICMNAITPSRCRLFPGATDKVRSMYRAFLTCGLLGVKFINQPGKAPLATLCVALTISRVYFFARWWCIFRARLNAR